MEFVDLSRCISPLNTVNLGLPRKRSRSWWIGDPKHIQNLADPIGPGHHRQPGHTISQTGYHIRLGMSGQPLELHEKGPFDDDEDFHEMVRISKASPILLALQVFDLNPEIEVLARESGSPVFFGQVHQAYLGSDSYSHITSQEAEGYWDNAPNPNELESVDMMNNQVMILDDTDRNVRWRSSENISLEPPPSPGSAGFEIISWYPNAQNPMEKKPPSFYRTLPSSSGGDDSPKPMDIDHNPEPIHPVLFDSEGTIRSTPLPPSSPQEFFTPSATPLGSPQRHRIKVIKINSDDSDNSVHTAAAKSPGLPEYQLAAQLEKRPQPSAANPFRVDGLARSDTSGLSSPGPSRTTRVSRRLTAVSKTAKEVKEVIRREKKEVMADNVRIESVASDEPVVGTRLATRRTRANPSGSPSQKPTRRSKSSRKSGGESAGNSAGGGGRVGRKKK